MTLFIMLRIILIIIFICEHVLVINSVGHTKINTVTIGGIFSVFKDAARTIVDHVQLENLHAFLLAIDEVNNRTDILPDYKIEYVIRSPIAHSFVSISSSSSQLVENNVTGVVGSLDNYGTDISNRYFKEFNITQSHSMAMGTDFVLGDTYPFKVQTVPVDSFQGMVFQKLLCDEFNAKRFIAVVSGDLAGQKFAVESHDDTFCGMVVPETLLTPSYQEDFSEFILSVRDIVPTVILLSLPPEQAAKFLEQAYDLGMLHKGVQVLTDYRTTQSEIFEGFSSGAPIENIMNGVISLKFWPEHFIYFPGGKEFIKSWRNQINSKTTCSSYVDATGNKFLKSTDGTSCVGLDFSTYFENGTNINAFAAYTYDATYVLLHGLHDLYYGHSTSDLHSLILNHTAFQGATGLVDIFEGMTGYGKGYAKGNREVGHHFKIMNYNHELYLKDKTKSFVQVGTLSVEDGFDALCTDVVPCIDKIKFNTHDNKFPDADPPYKNSVYPNIIKLGGLFSPFREDGSIDWSQVENLNAFLLAVKHINDKTDGILDDILPNSKIVTMIHGEGYDFTGGAMSAQKLLRGFGGTGVHGAVSALPNLPSYATNQVLVPPQVVLMHSVITDADFGNGATYSMKVQTSPLDTYQPMILQEMLCSAPFYVRKIGIFASYDFFGTKSIVEISDCTYCCINVISTTFVYQLEKEDLSEEIEEARASGATYFALFLPSSTTARIIEQGTEMGVFHEGTQLAGVQANTNKNLINHFKNKEKIPQYMKGFIGLEWWSDYAFTLNSGKQFMSQWKAQPSTKLDMHSGKKHCYKNKDDESNFFLYEHQTNTSICTGLDYSSYSDDGSSFTSKQVLQTYDATVAMAHGFHNLKKLGKVYNGKNLINEIMYNVTFDGVSGHVKFFEGMVQYGGYGRGNREAGHFFKVLNFNSKSYLDNNDNPFVMNHVWTATDGVSDGFIDCPKSFECLPFSYRSPNNKPVSDSQPDVIIPMEPWIVIMLYSFGVIAFAGIVFYSFILWNYRHSRLLKASQAPMLYIMMFGQVLGVGKILIAASPITTPTCIGGLWSAHLGFFLVFTTCLLKLWRVNKLVNNKSLQKMKITTTDILKMLSVIMCGVFILLILLTFVGKPHLSYQETTTANETTKYPYCAYEYPEFQILFYVIELLLLCYGVSLCWAIKDIPDAINESQAIAMAMAIIAASSYMCFPVIISQPPRVNQVIAGVGFFVGVMVILFCVFYPKAKILLAGNDLMKDLTIGLAQNTKQKNKKAAKVHPTSEGAFLGKNLTEEKVDGHSYLDPTTPNHYSSNKGYEYGNNLEQQFFTYPTMNQIPGTRQEKLRIITDYTAYWLELKKSAEQQYLAHTSENSRSSESTVNPSSKISTKRLIQGNDRSDQV